MRSVRSLSILALLTLGLVALVFVLQPRDVGQGGARALLFEDLPGQVNDVVAIELRDPAGEVNIRIGDQGWVLPEKHGYPADAAKVRSLVLGLAEARVVEPKTANPELYHRLGVVDVKHATSTAVEIRLINESETILASLLVGDPDGENRYVRRSGERQSMLVTSVRKPDVEVLDWLDTTILDVPRGDIQGIEVRDSDEVVRIERGADGVMNLLDIPQGKQVAYQFAVNDFASTLSGLKFEDVRVSQGLQFDTGPTGRLATAGGLIVEFRAATEGDTRWLEFSAKADEEASPETHAQVERLNTRWQGWAYRLDDTDLGRINKGLSDLLEEVDEAESTSTLPELAPESTD